MEIKDDDDDNEKDEENDEDSTQFVMVDYQELMKDDEEDKEEEATEEAKEYDEETDPGKIVATIIASLPHSPAKLATSSSLEIDPASLIVTTTDTSNVQSLFATSQLNTSLIEVSTTSSTELQ